MSTRSVAFVQSELYIILSAAYVNVRGINSLIIIRYIHIRYISLFAVRLYKTVNES